MKNISILEINLTNKNQRFLERLKNALNSKGFDVIIKNYNNIKSKNPITKLIKINKLAKEHETSFNNIVISIIVAAVP